MFLEQKLTKVNGLLLSQDAQRIALSTNTEEINEIIKNIYELSKYEGNEQVKRQVFRYQKLIS